MLRKAVAVLIVLNLLWWVWAKDWLAPIGLPSTPAGNPEFLVRQIHPDALHVQPLPPGTPIIKIVPAVPNSSTAPEVAPDTHTSSTEERPSRRR